MKPLAEIGEKLEDIKLMISAPNALMTHFAWGFPDKEITEEALLVIKKSLDKASLAIESVLNN